MRKDYTILVPNMLPVQLGLMCRLMKNFGYNMELLHTEGPNIAEQGLRNVHNDTCYPALLVIGQLMDAIESGKYDIHKIALILPQTGGGCRASNYIPVSYTHLDVYKRQMWMSLANSDMETCPSG